MIIALALAGALSMHPAQADAYVHGERPGVVDIEIDCAGIRGGKTHAAVFRAILRAIRQPTKESQCHAIVSPSYPMAKRGPEPKLREICGDKSIFAKNPLIGWNKTDHVYWVKNCAGGRSRVRVFSGEEPDGWRGDEWLSGLFDEGAYLDEDAWTVGLGRLASTDGFAHITTSPNGWNWVYELAERCTVDLPRCAPAVPYTLKRSPDGRIVFAQWGSLVNTLMPGGARGFERLAENYDPDTYAQEVEGRFVGRAGRVYKAFDEKSVREMPRPGDGPIYVGQDFNVERMASVFAHDVRVTPAGKPGLHAFDEIELRDANTYKLCGALDQWCLANRVPKARLVVVPDASGAKRQTGATDAAKSDLAILRGAGFTVDAMRSNPRVKDRVNAVNGLLYRQRLSVSERCRLLRKALAEQKYDEKGEPEKDGELDNRVDALGYVVWKRYPLRRLGGLVSRRAA